MWNHPFQGFSHFHALDRRHSAFRQRFVLTDANLQRKNKGGEPVWRVAALVYSCLSTHSKDLEQRVGGLYRGVGERGVGRRRTRENRVDGQGRGGGIGRVVGRVR